MKHFTPNLSSRNYIAVAMCILFSIANTSFAQQISGGGQHSLVLCKDSTVKACGDNTYFQLGDTDNVNNPYSYFPVAVNGLSKVVAVSAGSIHNLLLKSDGTVWAWGNNDYGQLGTGDTISRATPTKIISLTNIKSISAGAYFSLALKSDGTVWAWGDNTNGQIGDGTNQNKRKVPVQVSTLTGLTGVIAITAGDYHSIAIRNDHTVWAWGANGSGQLGNGTVTDVDLPIQISTLANAKAIDAGGNHSLALLNNGLIWAWGSNSYGQLGNGINTNDSVPALVQSISNVTAISAGGDQSLALKNDSTVWIWGNVYNPSVGRFINPTMNTSISSGTVMPVKVNLLSSITKISCGQYHDLAYKNDGTFWSWGQNGWGQLGNGSSNTNSYPTKVICPCGTTVNPTVSAGADITVCPNVNEIVTATATGIPPFSYQWSSGNIPFITRTDTVSPVFNIGNSGTYTCSVIASDNNMCPSLADSMIVMVRNLPSIYVTPTSQNICKGNSTTLNVYGGFPSNHYIWLPGGNTTTSISVSPTINTTYTASVTDSVGCNATETATVNIFAIKDSVHNVSCLSTDANGYAICMATGGVTPYTYSWSTGETTSSIYSKPVGSYSITVKDATGCTVTDAFSIIYNGSLALTMSNTNVTCNGYCDGKIFATPSGGSPPYTLNWTNMSYYFNMDSLTYMCAGGYTVTVSDNSSCSAIISDSVKITEPILLSDSISNMVNVSCYGGSNGSATVGVIGGVTPYTYSWSSLQTTQTISGLVAGAYTVNVTDANGCSMYSYYSPVTAYITVPPPILLSVSSVSNVTCYGGNNGSAILNASGGTSPYSYLWMPSAQSTSAASSLTATNYTATLTDYNGCTSTQTTTVTQPSVLAANISAVNVSCNGMCDGYAISNPTGGISPYSYMWNSGGSLSSVSNLCQGTFSLTITDANSCTKVGSTSITQPTLLTLSLTATNISCNGVCNGTATATALGGTAPYSYAWSNGQISQIATGLCAGTYSVAVVDGHGCSTSSSIIITQPLPIPITATATATSCGVKSGTAVATISGPGAIPPFRILWTTGDTSLSINSLAAGIYRVNVTDGNGCFSFADALVSNSNGPVIALNTITDVACNGLSNGAVNINVTGGSIPYSYHWSNGDTTQNISDLSYGPYEIIVSDAGGCTATQSVFVNQPASLSQVSSVINSSCTVANGSAFVSVTGGNSPYNYLWSSGATTTSVTGLAAGIYISHVTDSKGCTDSLLVAVSDSGGPIAFVDTIIAVDCGSNGAAFISTVDSASIQSYLWTNGWVTKNLVGVNAGNYGCTVTDTSGCKKAWYVNVPPVLPPLKPICVVTVDTSTNKNMVVWEKPISSVIAGFNIYRESSQNGVFQFVKYSPYNNVSTFYDSIVNPDDRWSKYQISMVDVCGKEGPLSPEHKTIHLSIQSTTPTKTNLIWDAYEGYSFTEYHIFRKNNLHGTWTLIDSVPAIITTYTDSTFTQNGDTIYYHIDVTAPNNCVASIKYPTPEATTVKGTKSNGSERVAPNSTSVQENISDSWLRIFPNPNHGMFSVVSSKEQIVYVSLYNMLGEKVYEKNINSNRSELTIPDISSGIYEIRIGTKNGITNRKVVISK